MIGSVVPPIYWVTAEGYWNSSPILWCYKYRHPPIHMQWDYEHPHKPSPYADHPAYIPVTEKTRQCMRNWKQNCMTTISKGVCQLWPAELWYSAKKPESLAHIMHKYLLKSTGYISSRQHNSSSSLVALPHTPLQTSITWNVELFLDCEVQPTS